MFFERRRKHDRIAISAILNSAVFRLQELKGGGQFEWYWSKIMLCNSFMKFGMFGGRKRLKEMLK